MSINKLQQILKKIQEEMGVSKYGKGQQSGIYWF